MKYAQKDALTDVAEHLPAASSQGNGGNQPPSAPQQIVTSTGETVTLGVTGAENKAS